MENNNEYFKKYAEKREQNQAHERHIEEFAVMCKEMNEAMFPIQIQKFLHENGIDVKLNLQTYLNGKYIDFDTELSNACARVLQDALNNSGQGIRITFT